MAKYRGTVRRSDLEGGHWQLEGDDGFRFRHLLIRDAAYEALPKATRAGLHERFAAWLEQHGAHPTDEMIELVAFAQTREYIKRVTSLYAKYRSLYGPSPYELPLRLDTKVAASGPDF